MSVSTILKRARDLMNDNGRHWIKGDFKSKLEDGSFGYCSFGAIEEVAGSKNPKLLFPALEALVKAFDPDTFSAYEDGVKSELSYQNEHNEAFGYPIIDIDGLDQYRHEALVEIIAMWNDDEDRLWDEVDHVFTLAAKKVS